MNARKATMIAAVLSFGLFTLEESALAQSNCKQAKARLLEISTDPATSTGIISNGGDLNGTTMTAFTSPGVFTEDPSTVSFLGNLTITTNQGELRASNVYLFNFAGVAAVLGRIDPTTSTGRFAGATGVLYFAAKVTSFSPFTVQSEISGEICFAK